MKNECSEGTCYISSNKTLEIPAKQFNQFRSKTNHSYMATNGTASMRRPYVVTESPLGTPRHIRIIMVGAGASGLNTAHHMALHMQNYRLTIYEKNEDVGGTWFENRYGCSSSGIEGHGH